MLTADNEALDRMEAQHPGIREFIRRSEEKSLPACPRCGSANTADVGCGVIGRTITIAAASTTLKLIPNGPKPGMYFCNGCDESFG